MDIQEFPDQQTLVSQLAEQIVALLAKGIEENGQASLAVSGGSTPVALFKHLSGLELAWQNVVISLVDERWVEPDQPDSNERLVRSYLLRDRAAAARFVGMKNNAATAGAGETVCEQQLQTIPQPFDVLILGMGNDGHTASLFPGAAKLAAATDLNSGRTCMGLAPLTAPHERMSLTLPVILAARQLFLHVTGKEKKEVLTRAMAEGETPEMPIRFILRQQETPLSIYWAP